MKYIPARIQIAVGLTGIVISIISLLMMFGAIPDSRKIVMEGRADLCEVIAISCSDSLSRGETLRVKKLLTALAGRHSQLRSVGLRRCDGALICEMGDHRQLWQASRDSADENVSTADAVLVPIRAGAERWGNVELLFEPLKAEGWLGQLQHPWCQLIGLTAGLAFIGFVFYLGKMLKHLDPSKTVPKRVRQALDSLAEGLLVIDRDDQIVLANQALGTWVHRDPEKLVGVEARSLGWVDPEGNVVENLPWITALRERMPQAGVMMGLACEQGTRVLMANASPVLGQDGHYRGVLVSFGDVTQLEETKRGLHEARTQAEQANQAKSDFLARMSHEIRTPMNAILGYTDVLRRGFDSSASDRQDYLDTIHASGEHLLSLINDILDLSKIESGRMELEYTRCSLVELLHQVVALLIGKAEEKGLELRLVGMTSVPETILTDAVRLKQTIVNLVGNAIKFTDKGSVSIEVAYLDDTAKPMLRIDVVDTGIGISPESLQRIFSPFAQADTSITRRFGGTGLGLSISKQLAKSMGGGIEVTSVENQGSRFSVRLAIGDTTGVRLVELESARRGLVEQIRPVAELKVRFPGTKILVADDGESNRKLVKLVLTRAGAEVVLAENGQQAVDAVLREPFDLVLMDMQMPIMDGYAATTTLRKLGVRLPIIALTAHAMQGDEDKCRGAGCSGFLTKPIQIDRLLTCIADELGIVGVEPTEAELLEQVRNLRDEVQTASSSPKPTEQTALVSTLPIEDAEFREIVAEFVTRLLERFERMQSACESGDFVTLASHAHWLKGSGGTAGFAILTEPARTLESAAKRGSSEDAATAMQEIAILIGRISQSPCVSVVTNKP